MPLPVNYVRLDYVFLLKLLCYTSFFLMVEYRGSKTL